MKLISAAVDRTMQVISWAGSKHRHGIVVAMIRVIAK